MIHSDVKLVAFDLDGTLTQHKTPLDAQNKAVLDKLRERYTLIMVGAGMCRRIFEQMNRYPIDIIGNYGMQTARYDPETNDMELIENIVVPCDKDAAERRITLLRQRFGYTEYVGDTVEYHSSGCITFPLLGTKAPIREKLAFDPDRAKRRRIYAQVREAFPEYNVVIGGSSSFDMAPMPYNKRHALERYCREKGLAHDQVVYVGDDYETGGNDEPVYRSDFRFLTVDDYRRFPDTVRCLLEEMHT